MSKSMRFETFLGQIQHRARLSSQERALTATRATLTALARRIGIDEANSLASQLPREIGQFLRDSACDVPEKFSVSDYYRKVADIEGEPLPAAAFHAKTVMGVVAEAVTPGEIEDLMAQLPAEYYPLFAIGSGTAA